MALLHTALIIIDVQNGMFDEQFPVWNGDRLLTKIKNLLQKAREQNVPAFYVQHNEAAGLQLESGTTAWEIHPDIKPLPMDHIIQKTRPDSFFETILEDELAALNIKHVILTGIQTDLCVDTTCRRANSLGYQVTVVADAHSTFDSQNLSAEQIIAHHNETLQFFAEIKKADEVDFR